MKKKKLFKIAAIPDSLTTLLNGQLRFLNNSFDVYGVASKGEQHNVLYDREGVKSFEVRIERRISLLNDISSLFSLVVLFSREKPEIIHSITPKAGLLSMLAGFIARVPVRIHTFTGLVFPTKKGFMYFLLKNMDRLTCMFATNVIPEGNGVKEDLINHRVTRKPLAVIANGNVNGIDTSFYSVDRVKESTKDSLCKDLGISETDCVFCFVGRIVRDKGINELITAFEKLSAKYLNCKLILVGNYEAKLDPLSNKTLKIIQSHKSIFEIGWQDDVRPYLAISDVLAFPSYREGFPNVVMQAGAMELPSIVSNINGCNEIIEDGVNGLIITSKDIDALYYAMEELMVDEEKRRRLSKNARKMVEDRYERKFVWDMLLKEYNKILDDRKPN
jgi:glycosyltransferase involved in cell wall biosynthesis